MKKQLLGMGLAAVLALAASPSFATGKNFHAKHSLKDLVCHFVPFLCTKPDKPGKPDNPGKPDQPGQTHSVPEIDAANAGLALALISGLVAIRRERRNRR